MSAFDDWITANGKTRETADALDEIAWLRLERQRLADESKSLRITADEREALVALCEWREKHPYPVMWMVEIVKLLHRHTPGSPDPFEPKTKRS